MSIGFRKEGMRWRKGSDEYYIQSDCGYRICKAYRGQLLAPIYTAWAPRTNPYTISDDLLYTTELDEAKAACDEHRKRQDTEQATKVGLLDR